MTTKNPALRQPLTPEHMRTFLQFSAITAALAACIAMTPDMPTPAPYEPPDNSAQRVREFVRGERNNVDEADLCAPSVPEPLRAAAQNLID
jgi:hypothetical protein